MTPVLDTELARKESAAIVSDLRQHGKSEGYRLTIKWFDALIAQYQAQMINSPAEKLQAYQLRIQQLIALRGALTGPGGASSGFVL